MNREIKFRVWNNNTSRYESKGFLSSSSEIDKSYVLRGVMDFYQNEDDYSDDGENVVFEQFTGLKDKNGVEIYEGDVLTYHNGSGPNKLVEYNPDKGFYRCKFNKGGGFIDTLFYYIERGCEVIGNIHENPELL